MALAYFKNKWNQWKAEKQRHAEELDRVIWKFYHASRTLDDVAVMTGREFEEFLARLFGYMGYTEIRMTPSNDQGGDLICVSPSGVPTVVQAKRWKGPVGNNAVQEVLGAMRHYGCDEGIVATNSNFTRAAVQLVAGGVDVTLRDKRWLEEKMTEFLPTSLPEFNRDRFDHLIEELIQITRRIAAATTTRRKRFPRQNSTLTEMLKYAAEAKGKELTAQEVKKLAHLHINLMEAETKSRDINRQMEKSQANLRRLDEEIAEIDEALADADSPSWRDDYSDR